MWVVGTVLAWPRLGSSYSWCGSGFTRVLRKSVFFKGTLSFLTEVTPHPQLSSMSGRAALGATMRSLESMRITAASSAASSAASGAAPAAFDPTLRRGASTTAGRSFFSKHTAGAAGAGGAQRSLPSPGAHRLVKAQMEALPGILSEVRAAGPDRYVKNGHYAWWVWPTTKPGVNDHRKVSCDNASDVAFMMTGPSVGVWGDLLDAFAKALITRNSRRVFPSIDHGRIDFFCKEWSSVEYKACMKAQPEFAAAVERFRNAWAAVK